MALAGACRSTPNVTPVSVQYVGATGFPPVAFERVEVILRRAETRPHDVIATLRIATDEDSTFEDLTNRLRARAAALGADALVEVNSVWDVPEMGIPSATSNATDGSAAADVAKTGLSLLVRRPKWIAVRGTAVRLTARHLDETAYRRYSSTDSRPSPALDSSPIAAPPRPGEPPAKPPVEKP